MTVTMVPAIDTQAQTARSARYYIDNYGGLANPETAPHFRRVQDIFARILQVADKSGKHVPMLRVVNSQTQALAVNLPDGHVIISQATIDICYRDTDLRSGDTRVAFVLGHELAHLAKEHTWSHEALVVLEASHLHHVGPSDVSATDKERQLKELQADDFGFLYAALAGYAVETLLGDPEAGTRDFFLYWVQATKSFSSTMYPNPEVRVQFLRARLRQVYEKLGLFYIGMGFIHFHMPQKALALLTQFQKIFPSKEVVNNIGYSYLQRALQQVRQSQESLSLGRAYHYCLPTLLEPSLLLPPLPSRAPGEEEELVSQLTQSAREYLRRAANADPFYLPAHLNLAIASLALGDIAEARAVIERAQKIDPSRQDVTIVRALILSREEEPAPGWPHALTMLGALTAPPQPDVCALLNVALILEEHSHRDQAQRVWARLASFYVTLSPYQRGLVCKHALNDPHCHTVWRTQPTTACRLSDRIEVAQPSLAGWTGVQIAFDDGSTEVQGTIYHSPDYQRIVLTLQDLGENFAEMMVWRGESVSHPDMLPHCCRPPKSKRAVAHGELWTCDDTWVAWIHEDRIQGIWSKSPAP